MASVAEFSAKIKEKYPAYKDVDDEALAKAMVEKYPAYKSVVDFTPASDTTTSVATEQPGLLSRAASAVKGFFAAPIEPLHGAFNPETKGFDPISTPTDVPRQEVSAKSEALATGAEYEGEKAARAKARQDLMVEANRAGRGNTVQDFESYAKENGVKLKPLLNTPEQYAEEKTGVKHGHVAAIGDLTSIIQSVSSAPLANWLRGKSGTERAGERVAQTEANLNEDAAVKAAKSKSDADRTQADRDLIEASTFKAKAGQVLEALKDPEKRATMGKELLFGLIEDAPTYILTSVVGGELLKAAGTLAKSTRTASRLAAVERRIQEAGGSAGESSAVASRFVRATETTPAAQQAAKAALTKPDIVADAGKHLVKDAVTNAAAGYVISAREGKPYDSAQFAQDMAAAGLMTTGSAIFKTLFSGGKLRKPEWESVRNSVEVAGLQNHPAIEGLLPSLLEASKQPDIAANPQKIRVSPENRTLTAAEAAELGDPSLKGSAVGGQYAKGKVMLHGTANASTVFHETTHFLEDVLDKRATSEGGKWADIKTKIDDWAEAVRAENDAKGGPELPPRNELFVQVLTELQHPGSEPQVAELGIPKRLVDDFGDLFQRYKNLGDEEHLGGKITGEGYRGGKAPIPEDVPVETEENLPPLTPMDPPVLENPRRPTVPERGKRRPLPDLEAEREANAQAAFDALPAAQKSTIPFHLLPKAEKAKIGAEKTARVLALADKMEKAPEDFIPDHLKNLTSRQRNMPGMRQDIEAARNDVLESARRMRVAPDKYDVPSGDASGGGSYSQTTRTPALAPVGESAPIGELARAEARDAALPAVGEPSPPITPAEGSPSAASALPAPEAPAPSAGPKRTVPKRIAADRPIAPTMPAEMTKLVLDGDVVVEKGKPPYATTEKGARALYHSSYFDAKNGGKETEVLYQIQRPKAQAVEGADASKESEPISLGSANPHSNPDLITDVAGFLRRNFTAKGDLPKPVFDEKIKSEGFVASQLRDVAYNLRELHTEAKKAYGGRPTAEQLKKIDEALKGNPYPEVPESVLPIIKKMRDHVDDLSRWMIRTGAVEGDMKATVENNMGFYLTRSYRAFDDPKWADAVPEDVRNRAKSLLRSEYKEMLDDEITSKGIAGDAAEAYREDRLEGIIRNMLYEGKAAESPIGLLKKSKLGSKDLSILSRRSEIAPEIRALYGEYENPMVNYARSVTKMANLVANQTFLTKVKAEGLKSDGFFHPEPIVKDGVSYDAQIAADESSVMHPLNGLYTTKEIKTAFEDVVKKHELPDWLRLVLAANSVVKFSKTVGSVQTHVRNLIGNVGFAVANGHWRVGKAGSAAKTILSDLGMKDSKSFRDYYRDLTSLGVVGESTSAGELKDALKDAGKYGPEGYTENRAKKVGGAITGALTTAYRAEDDVWKVYAFENEMARYRKAYPDIPEKQLKQKAAEIVRSTYPTYSMVPKAAKFFRRFPLTGTFVSFPAEVIRTGGNTIQLALKELKDPATRTIGAQRLAGITAVALGTAGATMGSRILNGISASDDKDFRQFLPPWSKNSQIVYLGKDKNGNARYIDLSYTDPYAYLKKPLIAAIRGDNWKEKLVQAGTEAMSPFLGEQIMWSKVMDISRNKTASGKKVYNPQAPWDKIAEDIALHVGDAFNPGTVNSMYRIYEGLRGETAPSGVKYDPRIEVAATLGGQRIQKIDPTQALAFKAREYGKNSEDAKYLLNSVVNNRGTVSESDVKTAYTDMDVANKNLWEDMQSSIRAAERLGVERKEIQRALRSAGVSIAETRALVNDRYKPFKPGSSFMKNTMKYRPDDREELKARKKAARAAYDEVRSEALKSVPKDTP